MHGIEPEEAYLKKLKEKEIALHEELVAATQRLKIARQEVASCEATLQMTIAQLNHIRRQMDVLWQAAP